MDVMTIFTFSYDTAVEAVENLFAQGRLSIPSCACITHSFGPPVLNCQLSTSITPRTPPPFCLYVSLQACPAWGMSPPLPTNAAPSRAGALRAGTPQRYTAPPPITAFPPFASVTLALPFLFCSLHYRGPGGGSQTRMKPFSGAATLSAVRLPNLLSI